MDHSIALLARIHVLYIDEELSASQVASVVGLSRNAVIGVLWRRGWGRARKRKRSSAYVPTSSEFSPPPSPAMIRLAEFDPVIARALKARRSDSPKKEGAEAP